VWGGGDGGRKRVGEGRGGSVAGVDERRVAWPCTEESEGGKRRGKHGGVGRLFEAEAVRQRRGGPGVVATWRAGTGKREGPRARRGTA
jgi:hypothetical protein